MDLARQPRLKHCAQRLPAENGVTVRYDGADMTKPETIEAMLAKAIAEFGAVDILVNNAGIQHVAPIEEFPVDKWNANHCDQSDVGVSHHPACRALA